MVPQINDAHSTPGGDLNALPGTRGPIAMQGGTTTGRFAWLAWSLAGLQLALVAGYTALSALTTAASSPLDPGALAGLAVGGITLLMYPLIGLVILWHRPGHPIGWLFIVTNLGWCIVNFAGAYVQYDLLARPGSLPGVSLMVWLYTWPGILSTVLSILLVLLFPEGRFLSHRWKVVAWLACAMAALSAVGLAFAPGRVDDTIGVNVNNPAGIGGLPGQIMLALSVFRVLMTLMFAVAAVSVVLRYRRAGEQERLQIKWVASALVLQGTLVIVSAALMTGYDSPAHMPLWAQGVQNLVELSGVALPVAVGIAILRYRLYSIDLIIRRTLIYALLSASLALVYWGGVALLQEVLRPVEGPGNDLAIVATTLLIAALFLPLRSRIQRFIDRRFYRRKYDAARTLAAFGQVARDEVDLRSLTGRLLAVVDETMRPQHISLWMSDMPSLVSGQGQAAEELRR